MKLTKICICAGIFLALTLIRFAFPAYYLCIDDNISKILKLEEKQTQEAIEFGEGLVNRIVFNEPEFAQSGFKCLSAERRYAQSFSDSLREREQSAEAAGNLRWENKQLSEAFLESQRSVTGESIPDNVLVDVIKLDFEYTAPVAGIKSSGFGYRIHPITGELKFHYGTDFAANAGTDVRAFADGTIIAAGESDSYGKYMVIEHDGGYETLYAHCSELCMGCGEVERGDVIALVGETGLATGPHLHFEISREGFYLNPEYYL